MRNVLLLRCCDHHCVPHSRWKTGKAGNNRCYCSIVLSRKRIVNFENQIGYRSEALLKNRKLSEGWDFPSNKSIVMGRVHHETECHHRCALSGGSHWTCPHRATHYWNLRSAPTHRSHSPYEPPPHRRTRVRWDWAAREMQCMPPRGRTLIRLWLARGLY